jgi:hypothetical protein
MIFPAYIFDISTLSHVLNDEWVNYTILKCVFLSSYCLFVAGNPLPFRLGLG